jgi:hypothetical protein
MRRGPYRRLLGRRLALALVALGCLLALAGFVASPATEHAQTEATSVHYAAGWNIVAAPSGTELRNAAGPQYAYGAAGDGYVQVNPGELVGGRAVWAYYSAATDQPLGRRPPAIPPSS